METSAASRAGTILWQGSSRAGIKQFLSSLAAGWQETLHNFLRSSITWILLLKPLFAKTQAHALHFYELWSYKLGNTTFHYHHKEWDVGAQGACIAEMADAGRKSVILRKALNKSTLNKPNHNILCDYLDRLSCYSLSLLLRVFFSFLTIPVYFPMNLLFQWSYWGIGCRSLLT